MSLSSRIWHLQNGQEIKGECNLCNNEVFRDSFHYDNLSEEKDFTIAAFKILCNNCYVKPSEDVKSSEDVKPSEDVKSFKPVFYHDPIIGSYGFIHFTPGYHNVIDSPSIGKYYQPVNDKIKLLSKS